MPPSGSVRDGLCSFIGLCHIWHWDLGLHFSVDGVDNLEHFAVGLSSQVLQDTVHKLQANFDFFIHGFFSKASLKWGSDGTP
jgi:hypothetical protein